jgi:hypothetical protein
MRRTDHQNLVCRPKSRGTDRSLSAWFPQWLVAEIQQNVRVVPSQLFD